MIFLKKILPSLFQDLSHRDLPTQPLAVSSPDSFVMKIQPVPNYQKLSQKSVAWNQVSELYCRKHYEISFSVLILPVISLWCTLKYCFWLNVKWWVNIAVTHVTLDLVTELPHNLSKHRFPQGRCDLNLHTLSPVLCCLASFGKRFGNDFL